MAELNNTLESRIVEAIEPLYSQILMALIIALLGLILGTVVGKLLQKILAEIELNRTIRALTGINMKLEEVISKGVMFTIYFLFIMWSLQKLGLGSIIVQILSWIVIIIIVLSMILSIKDFLPNMVAGFYIYMKKAVKEKEYIRTKSFSGTIKEIGLVETIIETDAKETMVIPNSTLMKETIIKPGKAKRKGGC